MKHALIIDADDRVGDRIEDMLAELGFRSFERAWSEEQALAAARRHRPDLVIVGERLEAGCPFGAARRICAAQNIPALLAMQCGAAVPARPGDATLRGPFPLGEAARAVAEAQRALPELTAA